MQEGDIVKIDLLVATSGNRKSKDAWVRIKKDFEELAQQPTNNRMLKCRFHNKGRGCPIGKVPCPEGHGCMLQIVTSAY